MSSKEEKEPLLPQTEQPPSPKPWYKKRSPAIDFIGTIVLPWSLATLAYLVKYHENVCSSRFALFLLAFMTQGGTIAVMHAMFDKDLLKEKLPLWLRFLLVTEAVLIASLIQTDTMCKCNHEK